MKKIILLNFIFILLFFIPQTAHGQDIFTYKDNIPGFTCGIAGDTTGKDKCCNLPKEIECNIEILNVAKTIASVTVVGPFVNTGISDFQEGCKKMKDFVDQQSNDSNIACISGAPSTTNYSSTSCKCIDPDSTKKANVSVAMAEMCYKYLGSTSKSSELSGCLSCSSQNGMWTGLGCLPLDLNMLISGFILTTGIGLGGGFAFLCIIYAAFMMQSSQGNPEKLKKAQEMITSCIMGLMLIIFSVFIMKLIGVNILRIPGFGG